MLSFIKYNMVSIIATMIDFSVFILLSNIIGLWYVTAAVIGAISGGITAFWLNRNWVFYKKGKVAKQAGKYLIVWISSISLNTIGIYLLVEYGGFNPIWGKISIAIAVGVFFNFFMNKYFIFK